MTIDLSNEKLTTLWIKANTNDEAIEAARQRGIEIALVHTEQKSNAIEAKTNEDAETNTKVMNWFCERNSAPFPIGTLLFYRFH